MKVPSYTTILHQARISAGLTCNEYVIASTIYQLQNNEKNPGWCYATKNWFGRMIGLSKPSIIAIISKLEKGGFVEKSNGGKLLRATEKWVNEVENFTLDGKESLPKPAKKTVKKVNRNGKESLPIVGKESLPKNGKESLPNNNSIENNSFKSIEEGKETPHGVSDDSPKKENLVKLLLTDFDDAFEYVAGNKPDLIFDGQKGEGGIRWNDKERAGVLKIASEIKRRLIKRNGPNEPEPENDELQRNWRLFLQSVVTLGDKWTLNNFLPSILNTRFDALILQIQQQKNGKSNPTRTSQPIFTAEQFARVSQQLKSEGY